MNKQDTTTKITLEEIARQKEEVLLAIREQKSLIVKTARKSFEPILKRHRQEVHC